MFPTTKLVPTRRDRSHEGVMLDVYIYELD